MAKRSKKSAARRKPEPIASAPAVVPTKQVAWPHSLIGTILVCAGAGVLLYPLFLSRLELSNIGATATQGPIAAVALVTAGIALLIVGQNRRGASALPFALDPPESGLFVKLAELNPKRFFYDTWIELDLEAERERAARRAAGHEGYDWRPIAVFASGAVFLALMEYFGHAPTWFSILDSYDPPNDGIPPEGFVAVLRQSPFVDLQKFVWWSLWRVLGFFILPALVVKLILRENISDYGLQTAGFLRHAWIYLFLFSIVLACVVVVSYEESFQTYYPFYEDANRSWYDFWTWELLYAAQFFSLEFFFRGFWLKAAKRAMGSHAIYAMVVPYCMIHFGKPFLETLGAIIAGVALGTLALRTRSIWSGFLIHVSVAISMDLAALAQTTGLPDRWWPQL